MIKNKYYCPMNYMYKKVITGLVITIIQNHIDLFWVLKVFFSYHSFSVSPYSDALILAILILIEIQSY